RGRSRSAPRDSRARRGELNSSARLASSSAGRRGRVRLCQVQHGLSRVRHEMGGPDVCSLYVAMAARHAVAVLSEPVAAYCPTLETTRYSEPRPVFAPAPWLGLVGV